MFHFRFWRVLPPMTLALLIAAILASPIGVWATGHGKNAGEIQIGACGQALCGVIADADRLHSHPDQRDAHNRDPALRARPIRGLEVLEDFAGGPPVWTGTGYDPRWGLSARNVKLRLTTPDVMTIRGCLAIFCVTQTLTRVR
jgi:uncharacterized protein (DUF2147 family)